MPSSDQSVPHGSRSLTKRAVGVASALVLGVSGAIALSLALVALVPLVVVLSPTMLMVFRGRRLRQRDEHRDLSDFKEPTESNDWYRRELARRGHIIDDRF